MLLIPSYLQQIGYRDVPVIQKLDRLAIVETKDSVKNVPPWASTRDIFEYLACLEYSKARLLDLPKGNGIGSSALVPARHDSASLVFFAQATLDNMAVWLNDSFVLGLKGNNISFYKKPIKPKLAGLDERFSELLERYDAFITKLNAYRMSWLHRIAGGAQLYSNGCPGSPGVVLEILVPLEPDIPSFFSEPEGYLKRIEEIKMQHQGRWLMPIEEFAIYIQSNTSKLLIELFDIAMDCEIPKS